MSIPTFNDRYTYLRIGGKVGLETFGYDRYLNQMFYTGKEWKPIRDYVITRDLGRDLAIEGMEIKGPIYVHHMNPITVDDIKSASDYLTNPEFLICTSFQTHNAIHYGDINLLPRQYIERKPNDTCPWKL